MFQPVTTLTDFILEQEYSSRKTKESLTLLLTQIENAAKIIASHATKSGLIDILGLAGSTNASADQVQKLDIYANELLVKTLLASGQVYMLASEELKEPISTPINNQGDYIIYFDPLDGSSNIDVSLPLGTIFSIYEKNGGLLQKGKKQIVAGYILYSTSTMFVLSIYKNVYGFTLDPAIGSFLLSHAKISIPDYAPIYSINESNEKLFNSNTKKYLDFIKQSRKYKARYVGTMVADLHRTLLKGGIFLYPEDILHKDGKLRLMYEVNPFSFLIKQAGGKATSKGVDPLDILPTDIHQRRPIIIGSKKNVKEYETFVL